MLMMQKRNFKMYMGFLTVTFCMLISSVCYGDWYLEQKTLTKSGDNPETTSIQKMYLKGKMMKVEDMDNGMTTYYRLDKDVIWFTNAKKKTYSERKLSQSLQLMKMFKQNQVIELKDTGNKKKIGKYDCHEYIITNKGQLVNYTQEMWVTKEIKIMKEFKDIFDAFKQYSPEMSEKLASLDGYPILTKITSSVMGTIIVNTSELTKVEKKKLDDKIFDIPEGFKLEEPVNPFQQIQDKIEADKAKKEVEDSKKVNPSVEDKKTDGK